MAAIVYSLISLPTPHGEVQVLLDGRVADTVVVELLNGSQVMDAVDVSDQWKIAVPEGSYEVRVQGDDAGSIPN